jgi:hypothetical protein
MCDELQGISFRIGEVERPNVDPVLFPSCTWGPEASKPFYDTDDED